MIFLIPLFELWCQWHWRMRWYLALHDLQIPWRAPPKDPSKLYMWIRSLWSRISAGKVNADAPQLIILAAKSVPSRAALSALEQLPFEILTYQISSYLNLREKVTLWLPLSHTILSKVGLLCLELDKVSTGLGFDKDPLRNRALQTSNRLPLKQTIFPYLPYAKRLHCFATPSMGRLRPRHADLVDVMRVANRHPLVFNYEATMWCEMVSLFNALSSSDRSRFSCLQDLTVSLPAIEWDSSPAVDLSHLQSLSSCTLLCARPSYKNTAQENRTVSTLLCSLPDSMTTLDVCNYLWVAPATRWISLFGSSALPGLCNVRLVQKSSDDRLLVDGTHIEAINQLAVVDELSKHRSVQELSTDLRIADLQAMHSAHFSQLVVLHCNIELNLLSMFQAAAVLDSLHELHVCTKSSRGTPVDEAPALISQFVCSIPRSTLCGLKVLTISWNRCSGATDVHMHMNNDMLVGLSTMPNLQSFIMQCGHWDSCDMPELLPIPDDLAGLLLDVRDVTRWPRLTCFAASHMSVAHCEFIHKFVPSAIVFPSVMNLKVGFPRRGHDQDHLFEAVPKTWYSSKSPMVYRLLA